MKTYLTIQSDASRIFGAGETPQAAQSDALSYTSTLEDTRTILAAVDVSSLDEIDADTHFIEIEA